MLTQQVLVILAYTIYRLPQSSQMLTAENWARQIFIGLSSELYKQWGINTGGAVRTSTLPIPFTNVFLAVASTSSEWCCPGCSATNTTVTTRAYQSNRPDVAQPNDVNWIIIGCQPQWGIISNNKAIFPLVFNVFVSSALLLSRSSGTGTWYGDSSNTTLTGISCVTPDYVLSGTYIAIGA